MGGGYRLRFISLTDRGASPNVWMGTRMCWPVLSTARLQKPLSFELELMP